jgi:hypothetical protein
VIDPEFAYYGPIAFDVGKILANLLLCFFAADGHATGGWVGGCQLLPAALAGWRACGIRGGYECQQGWCNAR